MRVPLCLMKRAAGPMLLAAALFGALSALPVQDREAAPGLAALVPGIDGWPESEERQSYFPESLFEYINGAAESYLGYDFEELLVVQFENQGSGGSLTLEIYDMGDPANAFGIFSAERYPEIEGVAVGDLGYIEDEALNFVAGRYYVKLLGFGLGDEAAALLKAVGGRVAAAVQDKGLLPRPLGFFPAEGLVPRSEKFIKKNFMGYEFLRNGFTAAYRIDGREVEAFLVPTGAEEEAESMLGKLLDFLARDKQVPEKVALGYHVKNRYGQHFFVGRVGRVLCGVARVPEGLEADAEGLLGRLRDSVSKAASQTP